MLPSALKGTLLVEKLKEKQYLLKKRAVEKLGTLF